MATISSLLADHVTLQVRSVDRLFFQGYVPRLQTQFQVIRFLRLSRHRCGQLCGTRGSIRPGSSAPPNRQGRRFAARCARPCRAALDRRAPLRWVAMNGCAGRATLRGAGFFLQSEHCGPPARPQCWRASQLPSALGQMVPRTKRPGALGPTKRRADALYDGRARAGTSPTSAFTLQNPCSEHQSPLPTNHIHAGRPVFARSRLPDPLAGGAGADRRRVRQGGRPVHRRARDPGSAAL